jgi:replicative DNA helicase
MVEALAPHSIEAEEAVLGAVLVNADAIEEIGFLESSDFFLLRHQYIFDAILTARKEKLPLDYLTITQKLEGQSRLSEVGGSAYIMGLVAKTPSALNADGYARIVQRMALRRKLIEAASQIARVAHSEDTEIDAALEAAHQAVEEVSDKRAASITSIVPIEKIAVEVLAESSRAQDNPNTLMGLPCGLRPLDEALGGFEPGLAYWFAGRPGMGKCLGKGTRVLMADGQLRAVEELQAGDLLMGPDSKPRRVLSMTKGRGKMYKIHQSFGMTYRVNNKHILSLKRSRNEGGWEKGQILNIGVEEYAAKGPKFRSNFKGYKTAVEFPERLLPIDPYFIGIWLGDGRTSDVRICAADQEIINYLHEYAEERGDIVYEADDPERSANMFTIRRPTRKGTMQERSESVQGQLRKLGLLGHKHIPEEYLINSRENRLKLLAGLIDSDGHYFSTAKQNGPYEIISKEYELALQIKFLCDSLGYRTSFATKTVKFRGQDFEVYRVRFNGNVEEIPVRIERKKATPWASIQDWRVSGIKVEDDGVDDYYGFMLDCDGLFLLEDMTVTHNSALLAQIAAGLGLAGYGVLFFSLEMGRVPLVRRMICQRAKVSNTQCRRGRLNTDDLNKFKRAAVELRNVWVEARSGLTVRSMQTITRHYARQHDIKLVIIDTVNRVGDVGRAANQYHGMTITSHAIADWAHESDYAIAVAAQLSRANKMVKDPRPTLDSLRDSGSQEEDADVVVGLHRPGYYKTDDASLRHLAKLYMLKNREGDSESDINLYWEAAWPGFALPADKVEEPPEIARMKAREKAVATA